MDLSGLILLVEIIDSGNLSQAARKLKMSRANVSYHLNQFEKLLGQQLVRRTTRRIEPTEIGLRLYEHGKTIQNELLAAKEVAGTLGKSLHGAVRLSVPTGFGQTVMSSWLIAFKKKYPEIMLEVLFENRVDDLLRDEVDIAMRVMAEPPQMMVARELASIRYVACAATAYFDKHGLPTEPQDLQKIPILTSNVIGRELRVAAYRNEQRHELILYPTLASENFQFLQESILAGLGVGLIPDYLVAKEIHSGSIRTTLNDWRLSIFGTRLFLLRMPGRYQTLATRTLIDYLIEQTRHWHKQQLAPT